MLTHGMGSTPPPPPRYYVLFMVDSCMGDKRNTQDINCGGLRKDTTFYSWLTVVWETKEIHKI